MRTHLFDAVAYLESRHIPLTESGCWIWTKAVNKKGYGIAWNGNKPVFAHRLSYETYNEAIPDSLLVMHTCDTPSCINPKHLVAGTDSDNAKDRENKGRGRSIVGEEHHGAKLTEVDVIAIRNKFIPRVVTYKMLAEEYNVTPRTIKSIVTNQNWKHV